MKVQAYCLVILIAFFGKNRLEIRNLNLRKWVLRWSIYPADGNDSALKVKLERHNWILTKCIHLTMVYNLRQTIYSSTFSFGKDLFTCISKLSIYLYQHHTNIYIYIYIYIYTQNINTKTVRIEIFKYNKLFKMAMFSIA